MAHGLTLTETASGVRPIRTSSLAVIGLMATSSVVAPENAGALDAAFPLNTPVLVSDVEAAAGKAGSGGTLKAALEAIGDIGSPYVIVVRVPVDAEDQDEAVIGGTDGNTYTGIQALLAAEATVGRRPRIIGAPGLDTQDVTAELVIAAKKLRGRAYAAAIGADSTAAIAYRENFSARELTLIWPGTTSSADAVARALGLRAQIDETTGWHKTISNVPIDGVTAISKNVHFDLLDPSTEAGLLNDAGIVTLIRANGFRFWGNATCADEDQPEYRFESAVRTLHALQDVLADAVQPFMDQPMTVGLIKDLLETANAAFRQLARQGRVIGAVASFPADANTADQLAQGRPTFRIDFTPVAPLENPNMVLNITDYFYTGFAQQLQGA